MTGVATTDTMLGWDRAGLAGVGAGALRDLYTSNHVYQAEQERLFSRAWTLAASSCEIGPGRYLALRIGPHSGEDGVDLVRMVEQFLAEDIKACEQLQIGAGSPAFAIGALARDHEAPLGLFHDLLRVELLG